MIAGYAYAAAGPDFTYVQNGADWANLEDAAGNRPNELCATGMEQSPIDLTKPVYSSTQKLEATKWDDEYALFSR